MAPFLAPRMDDVQEARRILGELEDDPDDDQREESEPDGVDEARASNAVQRRGRRGHGVATLNRNGAGGQCPPPRRVLILPRLLPP